MKTIVYAIDKQMMAAAFTEWDRRFREAPGEFLNIAEHLLFNNPTTYGEECAPYFLSLIEEMYSVESKSVEL